MGEPVRQMPFSPSPFSPRSLDHGLNKEDRTLQFNGPRNDLGSAAGILSLSKDSRRAAQKKRIREFASDDLDGRHAFQIITRESEDVNDDEDR